MLKSGEFRIVWKTNCKWKGTDYIVSRGDIKPTNCSTSDNIATMKIREGDLVKVKYGPRWYNAEVVEVGEEKNEEDPYIVFTAQQAKRELEWKDQREEKRRKLEKKEHDNEIPLATGPAADKTEQQLIKTNEREIRLRKRVDQLEEKHDNALNLAEIIGEMNRNMLKSFEKIEKRLEDIEMSLKSEATVNSTFDDITELNLSESGDKSSQNVNANNESTLSTIDIDCLKRLIPTLDSTGIQLNEVQFNGTAPVETSPGTSSDQSPTEDNRRSLSEGLIKKFVTPSKDVKKITIAMEKDKEPHKCALKLLPFFFKSDELQGHNTDGTHGKLPLDPIKLNSLRVLLFNRFVLPKEEEDRVWKIVKSSINTKCRATKFYEKRMNKLE